MKKRASAATSAAIPSLLSTLSLTATWLYLSIKHRKRGIKYRDLIRWLNVPGQVAKPAVAELRRQRLIMIVNGRLKTLAPRPRSLAIVENQLDQIINQLLVSNQQ